jgi:deazaflavin-dependent oxidoreductase (nitroreductase family)
MAPPEHAGRRHDMVPGIQAMAASKLARVKGADMPIPRRVGQWNKVGLNRLTRHIAPWLPGFGVVVHRGRRSGRRYRTPVNVFPAADGYLIALTYGPGTDWVKNVMAAAGCELETRGRTVRLVSPRLYRDKTRRGIRPGERQILRAIGVADFMALTTASTGSPGTGPSPAAHRD